MTTWQDMKEFQVIENAVKEIVECTRTMRKLEADRRTGQWANNKLYEIDGDIAGMSLRIRRAAHAVNMAVARLLGDLD